jgi:large subunit ribosomal protein L18Ae
MATRMRLYQVVGRKAPTKTDENPPAYRMKLFAPNEVMAKSRFWYFMHQMRKMKKTTGEILDVNEITEKNDRYVKNFGIWIKYNSRSGTHNMYREYRDTNLNSAIDNLYNDMAGRHRSRNKSIQIIRTATVAAKDCKRVSSLQFHNSQIKFPLPHRILRPSTKQLRSVFSATRPNTHFQ